MATKISGSQTRPAGFRMPTHAQLTKTYKSIADAAFKNGTAKKLRGPPVKDPNKYPRYDVTPKGLMDLNKTIYLIKGDLYQRNSGMGPNGIMSAWYKIGPAPLF